MATGKLILGADAGAVLTEVSLHDGGGVVDITYTVSSKRTPAVQSFDSAAEARAAFDAEVALCRIAQ
jgi:hypothetical protein